MDRDPPKTRTESKKSGKKKDSIYSSKHIRMKEELFNNRDKEPPNTGKKGKQQKK